MALEVRLGDQARLTKDIDLGLREEIRDEDELRARLIDALSEDADGDGFTFAVTTARSMAEDGGGHLTWRMTVTAELAGRQFGSVRLDVSPRPHELGATEIIALPNAFAFAGVGAVQIEIVDVHRHAAEKLHAMLRDFGDRENSRVRDLLDLMLLRDHELLNPEKLAKAVTDVWSERNGTPPPGSLGALPAIWRHPYQHLAEEHGVEPASFEVAKARAAELWALMFTARRP